MSQTRGSNGFGANRLTRLEIRQWERDEFISLAPWERTAILRLDAAWAKWAADDLAERNKRAGKKD